MQNFHVAPKALWVLVAQLQTVYVHHRVVKAVVEQHVAQVVHVDEAFVADGNTMALQQAHDFTQGVGAKMGEVEQAIFAQHF